MLPTKQITPVMFDRSNKPFTWEPTALHLIDTVKWGNLQQAYKGTGNPQPHAETETLIACEARLQTAEVAI